VNAGLAVGRSLIVADIDKGIAIMPSRNEYLIIKASADTSKTAELLNILALDGWQLVAVVGPCPSSTDTLYLVRTALAAQP
jgi:hypothetical protein